VLTALVEESWLKDQFKEEYENYRKKVPRFLFKHNNNSAPVFNENEGLNEELKLAPGTKFSKTQSILKLCTGSRVNLLDELFCPTAYEVQISSIVDSGFSFFKASFF
jgi:hypothetical protein